MSNFGEIATRVEERITSAPVADWLKDEARADLTRLVNAHRAEVQWQNEGESRPEVGPEEKVEEDVSEAALPFDPFGPPTPQQYKRDARRTAVGYATSNGVFHAKDADAIFAFLMADES